MFDSAHTAAKLRWILLPWAPRENNLSGGKTRGQIDRWRAGTGARACAGAARRNLAVRAAGAVGRRLAGRGAGGAGGAAARWHRGDPSPGAHGTGIARGAGAAALG